MDPAPQLQSIDQVPPGLIAVEQPLVILLENGPGFSALVASHVASESDSGLITLEDCTQIRFEENGQRRIREFDSVVVSHDSESKFWIASPDQFESIFSQPSLDPYAVLQLSREQAVKLELAIKGNDFDGTFEILRSSFATKPRFYSPSLRELRAPENYASGRSQYPKNVRFL